MTSSDDRSERIIDAAMLINVGEYELAEKILGDLLREVEHSEQIGSSPVEEASDAAEYLAEIALKNNRFAEAVKYAQSATMYSGRFRAKAHFIAAEALAKSGDKDLAISKLRMVASWSEHKALAEAAQRRIEKLEPED